MIETQLGATPEPAKVPAEAPQTPGQAPASPGVSVEPAKTPEATKPAEVASKPATPTPEASKAPEADTSTERLLTDLPPQKPTIESVKVPEGSLVPKETISAIIGSAKTVAEAQTLVDFAHNERQQDLQRLKTQNTQWITNLKSDPEFGGDKWEETKALYKKGVIQEFGENFAKTLGNAFLDGQPDFVRGVVRRMRALQPKPHVQGTPPEPPKAKSKDPWDTIYGGGEQAPPAKKPGW